MFPAIDFSSDKALAALNTSLQLLPLIIPSWRWPFSPRQVTHSRDLLPFLLAPWSAPSEINLFVVASRLIQASFLLVCLPPDFHFVAYPLWIILALVRTQIGALMTQGDGSTFPFLFQHWALYEEISGLGPIMVIYFHMCGAPNILHVNPSVFLVIFPAIMAFLDDAPWTYGVAIVLGILISFVCNTAFSDKKTYLPFPALSISSITELQLGRVFVASLVLLCIPNLLIAYIDTPTGATIPHLDILVLSFPRPGANTDKMLLATIDSFAPYFSPNVAMSVFTHVGGYSGYKAARSTYSDRVVFHADADENGVHPWGQYQQIAEALTWMEGAMRGDWLMLVEDDAPLCPDAWPALERVLHGLDKTQAASVGAGTSGVVLHRSQMEIVAELFRFHAAHPTAWRKTPEMIMQECLSGVSGICRPPSDVDRAGRGRGGGDAGGLVISSRVLLDHVESSSAKWRCGWRHPLHGRPGLEVVL
ncbi:hypothetical protein CYLTODRAFT_420682 [Cylindrobasidium torrendii FP15055 ss-10]|uniref:Uncharacterized protein n=1 Tax=Cylindrobasidium torrendii FP15055 ss-10 TaxID=1314674 RepID=A0A0D7BG38_9AGAR|nr:hypothetical protein CYLTODRAFT_420682 [Cylindrobasidium torrendii FP15055 ss-10]